MLALLADQLRLIAHKFGAHAGRAARTCLTARYSTQQLLTSEHHRIIARRRHCGDILDCTVGNFTFC